MQLKSSAPFGMSQAVLTVFALSLLGTAAIVLYQIHLRTDVVLAEQLTIFFHLYLTHDYPAAFLVVLLLFVGLYPPLQSVGAAFADFVGNNPFSTALIVGVVLAAGSFWVYQAYPLCMDEYSPYLQSQVFAAGKLTGHLPPDLMDWLVVPAFQKMFVPVSHETGQIASTYLPGFAILMTPFTAIGVPWMANPFVGAMSVLVIHRLALALSNSTMAAGIAVLFALASPAFTINAISFYSMPAHLLCNAVFVLLLLEATPARALAAGLVGGLALALHNPVPHALFAAPWLLWLLTHQDRWRLVGAATAGYIPWIVFGWFGWQSLLGSLVTASSVPGELGGPTTVLGRLMDAVHMIVMPNAGIMTARLIGLTKIWLWATPALMVAAGIGFWLHRREPRFMLLLASALFTFIGYFFVPFDQGHGWGFRYFHSAWFVLPVFAALAVTPSKASQANNAELPFGELSRYLLGTAVASLVVLTGYFAWQVHGFIDQHLAQLPESTSGRTRVLVIDPTWGYYAADLVQNDPFLRAPVVKMVSHGPAEDSKMIARYFPELVKLGGDYRGSVYGLPVEPSNPGQVPDSAGRR